MNDVRLILPSLLLIATLSAQAPKTISPEAAGRSAARDHLDKAGPRIAQEELYGLVEALTSKAFEGRGTGLPGEIKATAFAAELFKAAGLLPPPGTNTYYEAFPVRGDFYLGKNNAAEIDWGGGVLQSLVNRSTYTPATFSPSTNVTSTGLVFVGFGIKTADYDSYADLDVRGKWVMAFRGHPEAHGRLSRFGPLIQKAATAKEAGAAGIIFVKAYNDNIAAEHLQLKSVGESGPILPAMAVPNKLANQLLGTKDLKTVYEQYDSGASTNGFALHPKLAASFDIGERPAVGRNVIGVLPAGEHPSGPAVVLCAHIDHLGFGTRGGSRAKGKDRAKLHPGADDNASGTAALLEIAAYLSAEKTAGRLKLKRDIVFIAFSGEEMGLVGSRYHVKKLKDAGVLSERVAACINLDMLGRLRENRINVMGTGTSPAWDEMITVAASNVNILVTRKPRQSASDSAPFDREGIPSLFPITGTHPDYHTPRDTIDRINFEGLTKATQFVLELVLATTQMDTPPTYQKAPTQQEAPNVLIGMVPENTDDSGVRIVSLSEGFPADKAGLQEEDILVELAGEKVKNIEGLFTILRTLKPEVDVQAVVLRGGGRQELKLRPAKR